MKALILVGGYGTRLRPLTFTAPKPLVPFANVPISLHQIHALVKVGVKKIVLAVNVQPEAMLEFNRKISKELGIEIICSQEDVPMGTAGPLALAREHLTYDDSPFFMFNSDVICDFPLADMLAFHRAHGGEGSILVTEVKDPSKYGVVLYDDNGRIREFVEKPQVYVGNKINAGIYLFNPSVIKRVPLRPTSIEREIFPAMASESQLYCKVLQGYWMDIGQPKDYLAGTGLHLAYVRKTTPAQLATGANIVGNVLINATAKVSASAVLGPDVVVGPGVVIDDHARVKKSTLLANVRVKASALVHNSLIGWDSTIGSHAHVESSVLGADVQIANEITVNEVIVCPHKGVGENTFVGKIIM